ncbi:glycosyltransferase family 4 protein [Micromonospora okii]|uniref:glycosyltransferase family 4 protein n=1 Tax=Micromonospora okii TaxID=1182970 RepID=UPI001E4AD420|nr:glycosyltransferase family 4 protein [Micromonospora okii]
MAGQRVCVLLKTNEGGLWVVPQVEELRRRGHDVVVVLPPGPGHLTAQLAARGFRTVDSPFDFRFRPTPATLRGLWALRRLLRRLRPDVLKYHLYAAALAGRLAAIGLPPRRVHMVANQMYLESPVIRPVERLLWRMDDVTIGCTRYISGIYGKLGCPADRRPVATIGIDLAEFTPPEQEGARAVARAKARAEIGVEEDAFVALMAGYVYAPTRLAHRGRGIKGHEVLLAAWPAFHARHPRARLVLIGEGATEAAKAYRRRLIERFGVAESTSVTWLGWVPDLRAYYTAADVSLTPSLSEGSNRVVREASAMGVPSIVSDAGGLPEAVDDSYGWVVPRGDVAALTGALEAAHREFEAGALHRRGVLARRHALRAFGFAGPAAEVADIVERAAALGPRGRRRRPAAGDR